MASMQGSWPGCCCAVSHPCFVHTPGNAETCRWACSFWPTLQCSCCRVFVCCCCCYSTLRSETGEVIQANQSSCGLSTDDVEGGNLRNNYSRPEGQNVGNFLSDRPTSRVLAAPGGASSIVFGTDDAAPQEPAARTGRGRAPGSLAPGADHHMSSNNYARPDGQNCGNFLTDRKVGRVAIASKVGWGWTCTWVGNSFLGPWARQDSKSPGHQNPSQEMWQSMCGPLATAHTTFAWLPLWCAAGR
jgi:hypothetical protein